MSNAITTLTETSNTGYDGSADGMEDEDFPLQYLCVASCKEMSTFLLTTDPTDDMPYDSHGGVIEGALGAFDPNYKAVTHEGVCLHTCPSWFDDADDLKTKNFEGVVAQDYHAPYRLRMTGDDADE